MAVIGPTGLQQCGKRQKDTLAAGSAAKVVMPATWYVVLPPPPLVLSRRTQLLLCRGGVWDAALLWIMCSKRLIKSYDVMLSKLSLATCAPEAGFCITLCCFAVIKGAPQLSLVCCRYKLAAYGVPCDQEIQSDPCRHCFAKFLIADWKQAIKRHRLRAYADCAVPFWCCPPPIWRLRGDLSLILALSVIRLSSASLSTGAAAAHTYCK